MPAYYLWEQGKKRGSRPSDDTPKKQSNRRKGHRWTQEEADKLVELVREHGATNWKQLKELGSDVFQETRRAIDLKDKWRNLVKHKHVEPLH